MILTKRDISILKFVEQYGSISINQCSKIFFSENKYAYYQARRRLKLLQNWKHLNRYRRDMRSETIYYIDKKLSYHSLKVLDVLAELISLGAKIKNFMQEYTIHTENKDYRVDALAEFIFKDYWYTMIIEVDMSNFTSSKKLFAINNSQHFQEKYKNTGEDIFPSVLIIRQVIPINPYHTELFDIHYSDFTLSTLRQVF
ncbi:MAG: hypothetical protein Q8936_01290 [Bacillota bacterium]|nr:hypothetical protein [Bacillota bacterium]